MNRLLRSVLLFSALAGAGPAFAQYRTFSFEGRGVVEQRVRQLELRVDYGMRRGLLTHREGMGLRDQLWRLRRLESDYARNGLSGWESDDLDARLGDLWRQLSTAEGRGRVGDGRWVGADLGNGDAFDTNPWDGDDWDGDTDDSLGSWDEDELGQSDSEDDDHQENEDNLDPRHDLNGDGWDDRDVDRDGDLDADSDLDDYPEEFDPVDELGSYTEGM